jgi:hypothetical protein
VTSRGGQPDLHVFISTSLPALAGSSHEAFSGAPARGRTNISSFVYGDAVRAWSARTGKTVK